MCQRRAHRAENEQAPEFARVAATMHERDARLVRLVGHCSSDNAASSGIYAFGLIPRWTALRDSITLTVYYDSGPTLAGSTGIGLSAVAATKTYLNTVAGLALLAGALLAADPSRSAQTFTGESRVVSYHRRVGASVPLPPGVTAPRHTTSGPGETGPTTVAGHRRRH